MRKLNKLMATLLALVLCLSLLPMAAFAEEAPTPEALSDSTNSKAAADTAKGAADTAKGDAEDAAKAVGKGTLIDEVNSAYSEYTEALDAATKAEADQKTAEQTVKDANQAITELEAETNEAVEGLNGDVENAANAAKDAVDAILDENGEVSDVKAAVEAANVATAAVEAANAVFDREDATTAEKRQAANAVQTAANEASRLADAAQATLDNAQSEVTAAQTRYNEAKAAYEALINGTKDEDGTVVEEGAQKKADDLLKDAQAANTTVKDANQALKDAKAALEAAQAKEADAKSAAEAAEAAKTKADESVLAAQKAINKANAAAISEKLDGVDLTPSEDNTVETINQKIEDEKNKQIAGVKDNFKANNENTLLNQIKKDQFEKLVENDVDPAELTDLQARWQEAYTARESARTAYDNRDKWNLIESAKLLDAQVKAESAYNDIVHEMTNTLYPRETVGDYIFNAFAGMDHTTIRAVFTAKTELETQKANVVNYAEAAKAVAAAQEAQQAAVKAQQEAKEALDNYNAAKTALENAQALAELKDATLDELNDAQAEFDAAQAKLNAAQTALNDAKKQASDAKSAAEKLLDSLPTTGGGGGGDTGDIDIADDLVPLAGPVMIEDVLEVLYKFEGSPDGADPEGEFELAIAWGIANDLIDEDTDPEEIVTGAILKDILTRYAAAFDGNVVEVAALTTLVTPDEDIVDNCGEVLAEFLGVEYTPAEEEAA